MKVIFRKKCVIVLSLSLLGGCGNQGIKPPHTAETKITQGTVELHIKKGVTTKTIVLEKLGSPNITSFDTDGNDVWTYQKHSSVSNSSSSNSYGSIIIFGTNNTVSGFEESQRTMTLVIKFNTKGIVKSYKSHFTSF